MIEQAYADRVVAHGDEKVMSKWQAAYEEIIGEKKTAAAGISEFMRDYSGGI